jgi:signal transduction histidine kinase
VIGSLRTRLAALAAVLVVAGAVVGGSATWVLDAYGEQIGTQARASVIVAAATTAIALVLAGTVLVHRALAPLSGLVRASREVTQGRHPDEAFAAVRLEGELHDLATDVRTLALRLREIDATDRRFLMSVSHELRTPLTAITGHAQAIEDFADDAEMRTQSLGVIRREAIRLERLIEDIVDLARLRSNKFTTVTEPVRLDELGEHLLAVFDGGGAHGSARIVGEFEELEFHSDGQRILQILRNLVGNGLRYARSEVRIDGHRVAGHVRLSVFNDGDPITGSQQERIFEPFVGSKREGGMGLGLAIGRELAWALGGNLRCVDRASGAEFELTLPLEPPGTGR